MYRHLCLVRRLVRRLLPVYHVCPLLILCQNDKLANLCLAIAFCIVFDHDWCWRCCLSCCRAHWQLTLRIHQHVLKRHQICLNPVSCEQKSGLGWCAYTTTCVTYYAIEATPVDTDFDMSARQQVSGRSKLGPHISVAVGHEEHKQHYNLCVPGKHGSVTELLPRLERHQS